MKRLPRYLCHLLFNQSACEKMVPDGLQIWWGGVRTHPWGQLDDREGTGWVPDLTRIDSGWKDKHRTNGKSCRNCEDLFRPTSPGDVWRPAWSTVPPRAPDRTHRLESKPVVGAHGD